MSTLDAFALGGRQDADAAPVLNWGGCTDASTGIDELYNEYDQLEGWIVGPNQDLSDAADKAVTWWQKRQGVIETEISGRVATSKAELIAQVHFLSVYLTQNEWTDSYTDNLVGKLIAGIATLNPKGAAT